MNTQDLKNSESLIKKSISKNQNKFFIITRDTLSKKYYQDVLVYDLILKQNYTSIMQLPRLEKIVLNTTSKMYINDKKHILFTLAALELLSGQKPQLTFARKSVANFKVRQHQIIGCKVTLHQNQMYTFLDKLSKIVFPRIRDHSKLKPQLELKNLEKNSFNMKKSNKLGTFTFGLQNMMIFPELENHYELVDNFRGMDLSFIISNSNNKTSSLFLSGFQLPVF